MVIAGYVVLGWLLGAALSILYMWVTDLPGHRGYRWYLVPCLIAWPLVWFFEGIIWYGVMQETREVRRLQRLCRRARG